MAFEHREEVKGSTARERAAALAGALAEMGVARVAISSIGAGGAGGWRELEARSTDLPGELLGALERAGPGGLVELYCLDRPLRAVFAADHCQWIAGEASPGRESSGPGADSV